MNKTNWQAETDKMITALNGKKARLLLHACCAPCASASLEYLTQHFSLDVFFYNPNISSAAEFEKRLSELRRFVRECPFTQGVTVLAPPYDHGAFLGAAAGLESEPERGARCTVCFTERLNETAHAAKKGGYDFFATTLTLSPLKNAECINRCGEAAAERFGVPYLPTDLKKRGRYLRSIELSREYGLYRQNFCGCEFSFRQENKNQHKAI